MELIVSHSRDDETPEAKTRWFRSLPLSERMEIFCYLTEMALEFNPKMADIKNVKQIPGRIRILSTP